MDKKNFIKWIKKQINCYKPYLDIKLQNIEVEYGRNTEYLKVSCTYPYLEPIIYFSDKALADWKNKKLDKKRILHELIHIITDPLYCKAISRYVSRNEIADERELLTDKIAIILGNLIK